MQREEKEMMSDAVYDEVNDLVNNHFQIMTNKDGSLREMFRNNVTQTRDFSHFSKENALEIIEKSNDPFYILNTFVGGDFTYL